MFLLNYPEIREKTRKKVHPNQNEIFGWPGDFYLVLNKNKWKGNIKMGHVSRKKTIK